jgi:hypothetical protein
MTARVTEDEKRRAERREVALAMILAGKKTTDRHLSIGAQGWGCQSAEDHGPVCAVGLAVLWKNLGAPSVGRPVDFIAEKTGFSQQFWQGVSNGFEYEISGLGRYGSSRWADDSEDFEDGLEVGCQAARELGDA